MNVKDLKCGDLVELFNDSNFREILTDEFDINEQENRFVTSEDDSYYYSFDNISKIWREDENGNYILIFTREDVKNG